MSNRNTINDELNDLNSGLDGGSDQNPFSVPEGYFDGLASSVLAKIKGEAPVSATEEIAQLSPLLAGISKRLPYFVPGDYFLDNIEGLKAFTNEREESLVLSFVSKEMPFRVPTGYFAGVADQVLEKVAPKQGKVVPMGARKWMRFAVAAMVTGILAVSGIFYFNNSGHKQGTDPVVAVQKASIQELDDFIKTTAVNDEKAQVTAKNTTAKTDGKKIFAGVSDKELNDFLAQMPADDELDIN